MQSRMMGRLSIFVIVWIASASTAPYCEASGAAATAQDEDSGTNVDNPPDAATAETTADGAAAAGTTADNSFSETPSGAKEKGPKENGAAISEKPTFLDELTDVLVGGQFNLSMRLRAELADQQGLQYAQAYTMRTRIGYSTRAWHGLSSFMELEDIRTADNSLYNSLVNGQATRAVIPDAPGTELNQLFVKYANDDVGTSGVVGRQRIILDDHRFVGNVGWRQNEQTFDSATAESSFGLKDFRGFYSYLWKVNRIFGPGATGPISDFQSNTHIINFNYSRFKPLQATVFAYLLDLENAPRLSSNTFGFRLNGALPIGETFKVAYIGSYARQQDAADNPNPYDADYYFLEGKVVVKEKYNGGAGYEVLGSGQGPMAFQTPLATLHKFNGWADAFLGTPANGLQDIYFFLGATAPMAIKTRFIYHLFFEDSGGNELGHELDAIVSKKLNEYMAVLAKVAYFDGKQTFADRTKLWFQLELDF